MINLSVRGTVVMGPCHDRLTICLQSLWQRRGKCATDHRQINSCTPSDLQTLIPSLHGENFDTDIDSPGVGQVPKSDNIDFVATGLFSPLSGDSERGACIFSKICRLLQLRCC